MIRQAFVNIRSLRPIPWINGGSYESMEVPGGLTLFRVGWICVIDKKATMKFEGFVWVAVLSSDLSFFGSHSAGKKGIFRGECVWCLVLLGLQFGTPHVGRQTEMSLGACLRST